MRGLFGSIVGKFTMTSQVGPASDVEQHFKGLDKAEAGLARKVAQFVADGQGRSVLSTLGTASVAAAWRSQGRTYPRATPTVKMLPSATEDDKLIRFGEAMAALEPLPANSHWGSFGTKASPDWIRHAFSTERVRRTPEPLCSVDRIAAVAERGEASSLTVLDILFHPGPGVHYGTQNSLDKFSGADIWLRDTVAVVSEQSTKLDAPGRVELAHAIGRFGLVDAYLPLLVEFGLSNAKTVRSAAIKALTGAPSEQLSAMLADRFSSANTSARTELVSLALGTLGAKAGPLLQTWHGTEPDKKPREAIERALANVALAEGPKAAVGPSERGYVALDGTTVALPALAPLPEPSSLPEAAYALLRPSIESHNAYVTKLRAEHAHERHHWSRGLPLVSSSDLATFRKAVEATGAVVAQHARAGLGQLMWGNSFVKWDRSGISDFFARPDVSARHLIAVIRYSAHWSFFALLGDTFAHAAAQELRRRLKTPADLQVASDLWIEMGGKRPTVEYLQQAWQASVAHLDQEMVWPLVANSFDEIDEALGLRPQVHQPALHASNALDLLATLPKVPHRYMLALLNFATGTQKSLRLQARALLAGAPDIDKAIFDLLADGKQEVRAGAADWLTARGTRDAIPALRKALRKEKSEIARAAIITALERLGDDVSDCFEPKSMLADAETGLAKTSTKGLEWFPFDLLPRLTWQTGKPVDPSIVRWWVVLANKLKQPGSNALLDLWLARLVPDDAKRLGLFVLKSWIEHDTHRPSDDEGNAYAQANVDAALAQRKQSAQRYPGIMKTYPLYLDRDALFAELKRSKTSQYFGSANDSKGILALATVAEGADAAASVRSFLKDHGSRISQDKALLDVLAANPASAAIQVVLSTANRFKARTVQEHAAGLIERIAERRGWTPEELADRTIPTAGLDERGELELDCGEGRTFRLVLDAQDNLVLLNPAGQPAKALPAPRGDEEKPLIAEAKKLVATARKELKQANVAQTERLYEAMCLERRWTADEWERHLLRHPIVGRLLRRLVWIGIDAAGERLALFRPLDDGSLSDIEDRDIDLAALAQVQLAHASLVTPAEAEAWRAHLGDYEIAPLFAQFDPDLPVLSESQGNDTSIEDRTGWMIENFKLRGTATKLGFVRGVAEDGGVFTTYDRRYDGAMLVARIEFTGSPLPEENIPTALQGLHFSKLRRGGGWHGADIALKNVPPVLLAESWKTLHRIAAAGTGFDPAWEKKAGW